MLSNDIWLQFWGLDWKNCKVWYLYYEQSEIIQILNHKVYEVIMFQHRNSHICSNFKCSCVVLESSEPSSYWTIELLSVLLEQYPAHYLLRSPFQMFRMFILYISISKTSVNSCKMYEFSQENLEFRKNSKLNTSLCLIPPKTMKWSPTGTQIQLARDFSRCHSVTPIWPSLSFNMNIRFLPCHGVTYRPDDHQQALKSS